MNADQHAPRLLGAAFLTVVVTSLGSGLLRMAVPGSGSVSDILVAIANRLTLMRISILADLLTSLGVMALAALLYIVLNRVNHIMALVAFGWWLAEAIVLAVSKIGTFALLPLSLDFVRAGTPVGSYYQTLGQFLYYDVDRLLGNTIHMFFYCTGGILWYYLFYKSRYIPRAISLWGLIAVSVGVVGLVFVLFGYDVALIVFLPILPFELAIGGWLMIKGIRQGPETEQRLARANETI
jgi:hypothetical protein